MTGRVPWRAPYQGIVQIFDYNRPFYLCTLAGAMVALLIALYVTAPLRFFILSAVGTAVFWTCSSLLVSHYIYDRSGLYRLCWLRECLSRPPGRWINIHAGVDDCSSLIRAMFPGSEGQIIDIYDPRKMTEPSIKRARRISGAVPQAASLQGLHPPGDHFDAAFLIFVAHEFRRHEDRVQFFRDVTRVVRSGGELILVEHLRDWVNFLAFGPGFLHFFSKRTWIRAANSGGLSIRLHTTVTPFVHAFVLKKNQ